MAQSVSFFLRGHRPLHFSIYTGKKGESPFMEDTNAKLSRGMSPATVWALAVGSIIGFGCFILPPDFLDRAGPLGFVLGILIGAAAMLVIGKNISYMVERLPLAGGQFTYTKELFGTSHGFVCGWMLALGYISLIAMNSTALGVLAEYILPSVFQQGYLYTVAGWNVYLPQVALALFFILLFGIFNSRGGKIAGNLQVGMVLLLIGAVLLVLAGTLLSPTASFAHLSPAFAPGKSPFQCIFAILPMIPFLFVGFDTVPQSAEEFSFSPKKTFALILGAIFSGAVIYMVITLSTAMVWPWPEMVSSRYTWATGKAMSTALGPLGVGFLAAAICMGIWTGMNGFYVASSRLLMAMSRENMLPNWFGYVSPKSQTPTHAVWVAMGISLLAPWFGRQVIGWVVDMCSCGTIIGYLYTCLAAWKLSRADLQNRQPHAKRDLILAISGAVLSVAILFLLLIPGMPGAMGRESWVAFLAWIALGGIFYFSIVRRKSA